MDADGASTGRRLRPHIHIDACQHAMSTCSAGVIQAHVLAYLRQHLSVLYADTKLSDFRCVRACDPAARGRARFANRPPCDRRVVRRADAFLAEHIAHLLIACPHVSATEGGEALPLDACELHVHVYQAGRAVAAGDSPGRSGWAGVCD